MTVTQVEVISINNYKKYILDTNINNETCKKCRQKSETSQHTIGACRALTLGHDNHRHYKQPSSLIRNWMSCGSCQRRKQRRIINKGHNLNFRTHKINHDRSTTVTPITTVKEAYLTDAALPQQLHLQHT